MCWEYEDNTLKPITNYGEAFKAWEGGEWLEGRLGRRGLERFLNPESEVEDYTEDTTVTSDNSGGGANDDDVGFGGSVVGGSSDPSLKRRQRGSKNRLRKMMRKDLKIPTGRSVVSVKGVG